MNNRILVTCRQMQDSIPSLIKEIEQHQWELVCPNLGSRQNFSSDEMRTLLANVQGAIVGDDVIDHWALSEAKQLRAICKWGIGTDGIDLSAAANRGVSVGRTPGVFGEEVADVALAYSIGLARELFEIDRKVRSGSWFKPAGFSLQGLRSTILGFGDIGQALARRLDVLGMEISVVDPAKEALVRAEVKGYRTGSLNDVVQGSNFLHVTCPLTPQTEGVVNHVLFAIMGAPAYVVNVSRGPVVNQQDLISALEAEVLTGAALDVYDGEPLAQSNPLAELSNVVLGSHNASNTRDAAHRASRMAVEVLARMLG